MEATAPTVPVRTESVETTLSFAINPATRAVTTLQSPKPCRENIGATAPEIMARILLELSTSATKLSLVSNDYKSHITMDATNITVNALSKKSFALSQRSIKTFFAPGIL